jgi:hypothetical protein
MEIFVALVLTLALVCATVLIHHEVLRSTHRSTQRLRRPRAPGSVIGSIRSHIWLNPGRNMVALGPPSFQNRCVS